MRDYLKQSSKATLEASSGSGAINLAQGPSTAHFSLASLNNFMSTTSVREAPSLKQLSFSSQNNNVVDSGKGTCDYNTATAQVPKPVLKINKSLQTKVVPKLDLRKLASQNAPVAQPAQ